MEYKKNRVALVFMLTSLGCNPATSALPDASRSTIKRPILLELFTSQGCSSCPAADALMMLWKAEFGERVIPLTFHVDYWNRLGWHDPFSRRQWTERQHAYSKRLGAHGVYTPQILVDGQHDAVGSQPMKIRGAVAKARREAHRQIRLEGQLIRGDGLLHLNVKATQLMASNNRATIWYAVRDGSHQTRIPAGENAGRILKSHFVVRQFTPLGRSPTGKETKSLQARIRIRSQWNAEMLDVVVFAQDDKTGSILDVIQLENASTNKG